MSESTRLAEKRKRENTIPTISRQVPNTMHVHLIM